MAQTTSATWARLLALPGTLREYKFLINNVEYVKAENMTRGEISHSVTHSLFDKFSIGNAVSAQLTLTILTDTVPKGAEIKRYVRLYNPDTGEASEWIQKGVFYPNKRQEEDGLWTVEAFDAIRKADVPWVPDQSLNFPLSVETAVGIFASMLDVDIDPRTTALLSGSDYTVDFPTSDPENESGENFTIRQELAAIAAAFGGNFLMTDEGKLRLLPVTAYLAAGAVSHNVGLYLVSDTDGKTLPAVSRVTFSVDSENVYSAGSDTGLELTASVAGLSQDSAEAAVTRVLASLSGYQYQMFTAESASLDPAAEIGDGVTVGGTEEGITSAVLSSFIAAISDDGSGFPDFSAPGEAENPDEMPTAGPMSQAFARQLAQTKSYILKTATEIILGVKSELDGKYSEIRLDVNSIEAEVEDPTKGLDALFQILSSGITLSVSESTSTTSRYADITLTVNGTEHGHGRILITGNVNVSGELSAEALYAAFGEIADLTVAELKTSRRITKFLNQDPSDDDFIYIHGETQQFISGEYVNAAPVQATNPFGAPIFWEDEVLDANGQVVQGVYIGNDGFPHRTADDTRIFAQVDTTPYPVMVYQYNDVVKLETAFMTETDGQGNTIKVPMTVYGAGNQQGTNQARIWKGTDGFNQSFYTNSQEFPECYIRMTLDGRVLIYPLHISSISDSFTRAAAGSADDKAAVDSVKSVLGIPAIVEKNINQDSAITDLQERCTTLEEAVEELHTGLTINQYFTINGQQYINILDFTDFHMITSQYDNTGVVAYFTGLRYAGTFYENLIVPFFSSYNDIWQNASALYQVSVPYTFYSSGSTAAKVYFGSSELNSIYFYNKYYGRDAYGYNLYENYVDAASGFAGAGECSRIFADGTSTALRERGYSFSGKIAFCFCASGNDWKLYIKRWDANGGDAGLLNPAGVVKNGPLVSGDGLTVL